MTKITTIIGVIAGTPFDTKLGITKVQQLGLKALAYPISSNPQKQTLIQTNKSLLTEKVLAAIETLTKKGASSILLYCNSIGLTIDINYIRQQQKCRIISPTDSLKTLDFQGPSIGVLAANCQAVGKIEETILKRYPNYSIIGLGLLPLVEAIEQKISSIAAIRKFELIRLCEFFIKTGCHELILGCTHFESLCSALSEMLLKKTF